MSGPGDIFDTEAVGAFRRGPVEWTGTSCERCPTHADGTPGVFRELTRNWMELRVEKGTLPGRWSDKTSVTLCRSCAERLASWLRELIPRAEYETTYHSIFPDLPPPTPPREKLVNAARSVFGDRRIQIDDGLDYSPPSDAAFVRVWPDGAESPVGLALEANHVIATDQRQLEAELRASAERYEQSTGVRLTG